MPEVNSFSHGTAFPADVTRLSPPPFLRREPEDEASLEPPVLYN